MCCLCNLTFLGFFLDVIILKSIFREKSDLKAGNGFYFHITQILQ